MKLFSNLPHRSVILMSTVLILAALFAYYFWMYLPEREASLISKQLRSLQQLSRNLKQKDQVYRKTANSIYDKFAEQEQLKTYLCKHPAGEDKSKLIALANQAILQNYGNPNLHFIDSKQKHIRDIEYPYTNKPSLISLFEGFKKKPELEKLLEIELAASLQDFFAPFHSIQGFDSYLLFKDSMLAYSTAEGELLQISPRDSESFHIDSLLSGIGKQKVKIKLDQLKNIPEIYEPGLDVQLSGTRYKLFSTNIKADDDKIWTLYALTNAERFEANLKQLPFMKVIVIVILLLIMIFALPLFKLSLISPIERLHRVDVVLSTSSFVVCTSLLTLFLLFGTSYRADQKKIENDLSKLSAKVELDFEKELRDVSHLMTSLEEEVVLNAWSKNLDHTQISLLQHEELLLKLEEYPYLRNLYWLNEAGAWVFQLSTEVQKDEKIQAKNFKERPYFYEIAQENGWHKEGMFGGKPYYIQSISSWVNSEKLAVLSTIPREKRIALPDGSYIETEVMAASMRMHSLMDPVLPPAFSFCIIDEQGEVLFHSDKKRNLQENFLAETDGHSSVRAAIFGKSSIYADVNAGEISKKIYMRPLKQTPWMLVTEYDKSYIASPYLQLISLCVIALLVIGGIAFFQLYLISLFNHKSSKLRKQNFHYDWLWPLKDKKERYALIMIYNIVLAASLLWYHMENEALTSLQVLASFIYAVIFNNCLAWIILEDDVKLKRQKSRIVIGATLLVSLSVFTIVSHFSPLDFAVNLRALLMVGGISLLCYGLKYMLGTKRVTLKAYSGFRKAYWGMLFTYLFISSILPAFFIYSAAYKQEQEIWTKFSLYQMSKDRSHRKHALKQLYRDKSIHPGETGGIYRRALSQGNYYDTLAYHACNCDVKSSEKGKYSKWEGLLHRGRPIFTAQFEASNGFVFSNGGDEWQSEHCSEHGIRMQYNRVDQQEGEQVYLASTSPMLNWEYLLEEFSGNTVWLLLFWLAFLVGIFYVVRFATNMFFAMRIFSNLQTMEIDDTYLDQYFNEDTAEEGHKHLFVVALPFAGLHKLYEQAHLKVFDVPQLLNQGTSEEVIRIQNSQVVLEHFSYVIDDCQANKSILDIVEHLLRNQNNIIIVSRMSPTQMIDHYEARVARMDNFEQRAEMEVLISKWKDILAGFVKVFYSMLHENSLKQKYSDDFSIKELLAYEFRVNEQYFKRIRKAFTQKWEPGQIELTAALEKIDQEKEQKPLKHQDVKEEIILKIQSMAQPFYFSLWNTCSKEEKYLLYDLAMDGFVNTKNERGLKKLIEKGLIYYQGSLQLMNESFRNFILSTIKETESLAMEKELRQTGTWSLYSAIFLILLLSLIVFVSLSQKEVISQFVALIAGLATAIPYLLRFSGFFSAFGGKEKLAVSG